MDIILAYEFKLHKIMLNMLNNIYVNILIRILNHQFVNKFNRKTEFHILRKREEINIMYMLSVTIRSILLNQLETRKVLLKIMVWRCYMDHLFS